MFFSAAFKNREQEDRHHVVVGVKYQSIGIPIGIARNFKHGQQQQPAAERGQILQLLYYGSGGTVRFGASVREKKTGLGV